QVRDDHVAVQRHREARLVDLRELLDHHDAVQEVASRPAVLLFEPRTEEPLRSRLPPHLAIDAALVSPTLLVRHDLLLHELPKRLAKALVLLPEDRALHRRLLLRPRRSNTTRALPTE